jgi:hypothetical protein
VAPLLVSFAVLVLPDEVELHRLGGPAADLELYLVVGGVGRSRNRQTAEPCACDECSRGDFALETVQGTVAILALGPVGPGWTAGCRDGPEPSAVCVGDGDGDGGIFDVFAAKVSGPGVDLAGGALDEHQFGGVEPAAEAALIEVGGSVQAFLRMPEGGRITEQTLESYAPGAFRAAVDARRMAGRNDPPGPVGIRSWVRRSPRCGRAGGRCRSTTLRDR